MIRSRDPARRAALDALIAVDTEGAYLNLILPRLLRERSVSTRDAAFATEIGYGSGRQSGVLCDVITAASGREVTKLEAPVRALLILGSYQLLHTRVPARAAVASTVDLAREVDAHRAAGLVNAVLRRVSELTWPGWVDRLAPADEVGRIAFMNGYPRWIADAWLQALGGDIDQLRAALHDVSSPAVQLAARPGRISRDELLAQSGNHATTGRWSPWAITLSGGDPGAIKAVSNGAAGVQDEGSQLVALLTCSVALDGPDAGRWLDSCAGPGGKAALLAGLLPDFGKLVAADVSPHRSVLVAKSLTGAPHPERVATVIADGRRPAWSAASFDRVLLDAPCSGLGALRRRPEARWRKQPGDPADLAKLQIELLHRSLDATRPGGVTVYSTCSPHLTETRHVVDTVIAERSDSTRLDARAALADAVPDLTLPDTAADPRDVQLWPHLHGTDAMYLALIRR